MAPTLQPYIQTPRLILRSPRIEDAAQIATLFQNPRSSEFEPHKPQNPTTEHYASRIPIWDADRERGKAAFMVVAVATKDDADNTKTIDTHVIGLGGINQISEKDSLRIADVGVLINSPEWRKGYGREALERTFEYAFREAECDVIEFTTLTINLPFRGLAAKMGLDGFKTSASEGKELEYRVTRLEWEEVQRKREGIA